MTLRLPSFEVASAPDDPRGNAAQEDCSKNSTIIRSLALAVAVLIIGGAVATTASQESTPPANEVPPIVIAELGRGLPAGTPGEVLLLQRAVIQPGAVVPSHRHPADIVFAVEKGTLGYTFLDGSVEILRAATSATPGPVETLGPGVEAILQPGDAVFEPEGVVHVARNAGGEPVVLYLASLAAADQPFLLPVETAGTPTP